MSDFDFQLPNELIAQEPLVDRTASRLLNIQRTSGTWQHRIFAELPDLLQPGDLLVMNDSKVLPARIYGIKRDTGARIELLMLKKTSDDSCWQALAKPAKRLKVGVWLDFYDNSEAEMIGSAEVIDSGVEGIRTLRFTGPTPAIELMLQIGEMPLPPYIRHRLQDQNRYQTVYANQSGSAAAPTAGLHFTPELLSKLDARGIRSAQVTLHVGLGTFRPITAERTEDHVMHSEYYTLPSATVRKMIETRRDGGRIIAVGTTTVRTLETAARQISQIEDLQPSEGWSELFITPGFRFRLVDALITNFHLPKSTLLMLVSAFAGTSLMLNAYQEAVTEQYRFFSFGDAMLIE